MREPEYRYAIEIFWSEEDGCFIARVPDLENCAAWGITYEQALAQAHRVIQADLISRRVSLGECSETRPLIRHVGFCLRNRSLEIIAACSGYSRCHVVRGLRGVRHLAGEGAAGRDQSSEDRP